MLDCGMFPKFQEPSAEVLLTADSCGLLVRHRIFPEMLLVCNDLNVVRDCNPTSPRWSFKRLMEVNCSGSAASATNKWVLPNNSCRGEQPWNVLTLPKLVS